MSFSWFGCILRLRLIFRLSPSDSSAVSTPARGKYGNESLTLNRTNPWCIVSHCHRHHHLLHVTIWYYFHAPHLCGWSFCFCFYMGEQPWRLMPVFRVKLEHHWSLPTMKNMVTITHKNLESGLFMEKQDTQPDKFYSNTLTYSATEEMIINF